MEIKLWWNARSKSVRLGDCNSESKWKLFWRKIKRENKKFSRNSSIASSFLRRNSSVSPSSQQAASSYDMDSYAKNFDQGSGWAELENRFRSFSARFALQSKLFKDDRLMDRY